MRHCADTTKAWEATGFRAEVAIREGLERYVAWARQQGERAAVGNSEPVAARSPFATGNPVTPSVDNAAGRRLLVIGADGFIGSAVVRAGLGAGAAVTACCAKQPWRLAGVEGDPQLSIVDLSRWWEQSRIESLEPLIAAADAVALLAYQPPPDRFSARRHELEVNTAAAVAIGRARGRARGAAGLHELGRRLRALARGAGDRGDSAAAADPLLGGEARGGASPRARPGIGRHAAPLDRLRAGRGRPAGGPLVHPAFLRSEAPVLHGDGTDIRDYVHVEDVAAAIVNACLRSSLPATINLGTGVGRSTEEVLRAVAAAMEVEPEIEKAPSRGPSLRLVVDPALAVRELDFDPRREFGPALREEASLAARPARLRGGGMKVAMLLENNPYPQDVRVRNEAESLASAGHRGHGDRPALPRAGRRRADRRGDCPPLLAARLLRRAWAASCSSTRWHTRSSSPAACASCSRGADVIHLHNPPDTLFPVGLLARALGRKVVFDHHDPFPELFAQKFGDIEAGGDRRRQPAGQPADRHRRPLHQPLAGGDGPGTRRRASGEADRGSKRAEALYPRRRAEQPRRGRAERSPSRLRRRAGGAPTASWTFPSCWRSPASRRRHSPWSATVASAASWRRPSPGRGSSDRVEFTGQVEHRRVPELIAAADICIDPAPCSELNHRSTMIKVTEYLAGGRPVVAFELTETRRTAEDAALYAPCGDLDGFARLIVRLARERRPSPGAGGAGGGQSRGAGLGAIRGGAAGSL